ncbi:hypothetical protein PJ985_09995 [Streptomyces sp. ACA25]|uniref:hypothetical protein n=1 Tax=Streptomyces sp. ACA25 TaxID=3022596 RepID=UPI00230726D2|nr:hypothetical protein [Streptomyces sp. ACA25]MDB1087896.1 hypothetical protein [Streptomyces sp. ACA25]
MLRASATRAAAAAALIFGLAACTAGTGGDDRGNGGSTAETAATPLEPGTHSGLPEPCGAVSEEQLDVLLPGADPEVRTGQPDLTYDTSRRVGCQWRSSTETGAHHLAVDFHRVISYHPGISDDDQAALDFAARSEAAGIPSPEDPAVTPESSGSPPGSGGTGDGPSPDPDPTRPGGGGTAGEGADSGSPTGEQAPRALSGIGQNAFLNDEFVSGDAGAHRDITLAFRSANVLVTVSYSESATDRYVTPDSATLQDRAQALARQLAARFTD